MHPTHLPALAPNVRFGGVGDPRRALSPAHLFSVLIFLSNISPLSTGFNFDAVQNQHQVISIIQAISERWSERVLLNAPLAIVG